MRGRKFLEQYAHDLGKLALFGWREMIKAGSHMLHPVRRRAGWQAHPVRRVSKPWPDEPGQARMEAARPDAERARETLGDQIGSNRFPCWSGSRQAWRQLLSQYGLVTARLFEKGLGCKATSRDKGQQAASLQRRKEPALAGADQEAPVTATASRA